MSLFFLRNNESLHQCLKSPQRSSISQQAHPHPTDVVRAPREKGLEHRRHQGTVNRPEGQVGHQPAQPRCQGPPPKAQDTRAPDSRTPNNPGRKRHPPQTREPGEGIGQPARRTAGHRPAQLTERRRLPVFLMDQ